MSSLSFLTLITCSLNTIVVEALSMYCIKCFFVCSKVVYAIKFYNLTGRSTFIITLIFFAVSLANNWVIGIGIPFPIIIVSRSVIVANVLLTNLLQNRHYSVDRIISVLSVTCGIIFFTLNSQTNSDLNDDNFGIITLFLTMFASAYLGILQEKIFYTYGKHPDEMMFYVHLLSLPLFVFVSKEIQNDLKYYWNASNRDILFSLIVAIIVLQLSFINQVYLHKMCLLHYFNTQFTSNYNASYLKKHQFDWKHFLSTLLVLVGTFTFYEGHIKVIEWVRKNRRRSKND
ncbi:Hira domain-containing protein [Meloidogyne graminicola]|uniref:Hira domain-containing protein n=1 Tax=Meloidogyne graminicola TaxID=189291 RepID=A0A8S9ZTJ5_9BILA|nr:Hira domain-containing protein [Meloidogyne graminicola]